MKNPHCDAIISAIGDGITVHDRDFTIIYQNPVMQDVFGNCVGDKCYNAYEQNETICNGCPAAMCLEDGKIHDAERHIMVNGARRIVENRAAPVYGSSGEVIAVVEVVRDITDRKYAEDRVARFRDLYAALSHTNKAIIQVRIGKACSTISAA